ncbi:hypothetical protein [Thiobacillus sp.]|uniref:hypothetical protein n=1 Tax=Thiobacillus sp. TaxID=924 RepID=UPI0025EB288C|nr:hypothetical protein [Thiobacillus sp.]MBT9538729.1 hypothetical protein [Thiobacillus sp.]
MLFNQENYLQIKQACESKREIEFIAPIEITAFSAESAPREWTAYPPCILPPQGYAQVFVQAGSDARGALIKLELVVHLDGGRILYKAQSKDQVALKVTWPAPLNA